MGILRKQAWRSVELLLFIKILDDDLLDAAGMGGEPPPEPVIEVSSYGA